MVFFICNYCGESVKKAAVEKHYSFKCGNKTKNVSCMDCLKDFIGENYVGHSFCISETEKYSGKLYAQKETKIKNLLQNNWLDIINRILESDLQLTGQVRTNLKMLRGYNNIPQKKVKFYNFVSNCLKMAPTEADAVWTVLEAELLKVKKEFQEQKKLENQQKANNSKRKISNLVDTTSNTNNLETKENQENEVSVLKKPKISEISEDNENKDDKNDMDIENKDAELNPDTEEIFPWSDNVEKVMSNYEKGVKVTKLKKKLLKLYKNHHSVKELGSKQNKTFEKRFQKTLKKMKSLSIKDEVVVHNKTN